MHPAAGALVATIDFETYSAADLPCVGAWRYAQDHTTEILCLAYMFGDAEPELWTPGQPFPARLADHLACGGIVEAHNAEFELAIWTEVGCKRLGWPALPLTQLRDSAAAAAAQALPRHLGTLAECLGVEQQKDDAGKRLMMRLCKPAPPVKASEDPKRLHTPENLERLYEYCKQDVRAEHAVSQIIPPLSRFEEQVWRITVTINKRGVRIDRPAAERLIELCETYKRGLDVRMHRVTQGAVTECTQAKALAKWLGVPSVAKDVIDDLIGVSEGEKREALKLRKLAAKTSTAKIARMLECLGDDDRARGLHMYHGATTGRWAGRLIQTQNLPRPNPTVEGHEDEVLADLLDGDLDWVAQVWCHPLEAVSSVIRSLIVPTPGARFLDADYASVESRVLAWLAGDESALADHRAGRCLYKVAAMQLYGIRYDEVTKAQRTEGKPSELGLGFGGGIGAYLTMVHAYGIDLGRLADVVLPRATDEQRDRAEWSAARYLESSPGAMPFEHAVACDVAKQIWREHRQPTVQFWADCETAAVAAVRNPGRTYGAGKVQFRMLQRAGMKPTLYMRLPSQRLLAYPDARLVSCEKFGRVREEIRFWGEDSRTRQWGWQTTYGGRLAENATQAVARDLLAAATLRVEAAGYPVVLTTHDQLTADTARGGLDTFIQLMTQLPPWAKGLPLAAEGAELQRYRK